MQMSSNTPPVIIDGELAVVEFSRFDLDGYELFIRAKALPDVRVDFNWKTDTYRLSTAARFAPQLGVSAAHVTTHDVGDLADHLFDYQRWAVGMALDAKRFAVWLDTGLGKTAVYLEWARHVQARTGGRVLILAPLAVLRQIADEARRFYGDLLPTSRLATRESLIDYCCHGDPATLGLCNYEKFIPGQIPELRLLGGLVADESSLLKTGGGVIKWNLIKSARGIEYKLSCTATPAPNDAMEYASQAAFLEKLRTEGEILWTYFHKTKKNEWIIKPHAKPAFYRFMASWSLYIRDPATFGFADILASLPDPIITEERIPLTDEQRHEMTAILAANNAGMFGDSLGVTARTKLAQLARGFLYEGRNGSRATRLVRAAKPQAVAEWAIGEMHQGRPTLIWTAFDAEGEIVRAAMRPGRFEVAILSGDTPESERLAILDRFRASDVQALISKPSLIGYGLNLQFVKSMVFSGFDDSFERTYQAIRRAYRFGQTDAVRVFFPYVPELEGLIFDNIRAKETRFLAEVAAQERLYREALT